MKQNKTKTILEAIEILILSIPTLLMCLMECTIDKIKVKSNTKISKYLVIPLRTIQFIMGIPFIIIYFLFDCLFNYIEKKSIRKNAEFQEFIKSNLTKQWLIDDQVKLNVSLESSDFDDDIFAIYEAYTKILKIIEEVKYNVSDDIKYGMIVLNSNIHILSETIYNASHYTGSSGCFFTDNKNIYIKLGLDNTENYIVTLHHEIAHLIDFVVGFNEQNLNFEGYFTSYDNRIHEAFEKEVSFLRDYAKTDYQEFFAVAYAHKMTDGNMINLKQINHIIDWYLETFRYTIDCIEYCGY